LNDASEPLPQETRERGQRRLILYLISGSIAGQITISNAPLFLLALGATPFHIGLLATLLALASTSRLPGARALPYFGKARTLYLGRVLGSICPLLLIPVAMTTDLSSTVIWLAVGLFALRQIVVQAGGAAFWPLVQDNTSTSSLSAFITRQKLSQRLLALTIPLAAGWYLGAEPSAARFAAPFAFAAVVGAVGAWLARRMSERTQPKTTERYLHRVWSVLQFPAVRGYTLCFGVCRLVNLASMTFWVIVLQDRGMPVNYYVWLTALAALGEVLTLYGWGRLIEAHGYRAVLTATLIPWGLAAPVWLVLPVESTPLIIWGAVFYFLWGVISGGWNFGETRAMIDAVPDGYQGEGFAVMMFVLAVTGALGAFVGGLVFDWANTLPAATDSSEPTLVYLMVTQSLLICGWFLCRLLKDYHDQPSLTALVGRLAGRCLGRTAG
jgi:hypothetical protein